LIDGLGARATWNAAALLHLAGDFSRADGGLLHPTHPHPIAQAQGGPRFAKARKDGAPGFFWVVECGKAGLGGAGGLDPTLRRCAKDGAPDLLWSGDDGKAGLGGAGLSQNGLSGDVLLVMVEIEEVPVQILYGELP
jgi:hypothetical protein